MRLRGKKGALEILQAQPELVVLDGALHQGKWQQLFGNDQPIYVELGMGKGRFIAEMSVRYPHINFIGVDMYDELIYRASEKGKELHLEQHNAAPANLLLLRANIESIETIFAANELERIYLNFSDPWPKAKHARRRLTHPNFLNKYKESLNDRGEIHFKTDSRSLFEFSLNSFAQLEWKLGNIALDLHKDGPREDLVFTEYESKFMEQGMPIYRLEAAVGEQAIRKFRETIQV
ncbi:tRNA (guanosine(46)-N7)-methyltransferase TrmB [Paenibacillus yanchengensis]|uniref:tRNA (guanine-N(7)-)-methyltransferase n=1 Tax=Paenibacillus yanchengensis TaxID=2035833 RepID=A0ABW4YFP2_9BACL